MTISDRQFHRIVLGAVAIAFLTLIVAGGTAGWLVTRNQSYTGWVNHTYQVEGRLSSLRLLLEQGETARRGYLLDPQAQFRHTFQDAAGRIPPVLDDLMQLTVDNTDQQRRLHTVRPLIDRQFAVMRRSLDARRSLGAEKSPNIFRDDDAPEMNRAIRAQTRAMAVAESRLLGEREADARSGVRILFIVLVLAGILLLGAAGGSIWIIRRYTRDLNRSQDALRTLNNDLEGAVAERTTDLQRANDEIQRFAYIVSHDLRSPLVNVMGFTAELDTAGKTLVGLIERIDMKTPEELTQDERLAAREDLPEAINFIRTSTQKMDRLINAILNLSREGRKTMKPGRIDMDGLVGSIFDSMRHRLDESGTEVTMEPPLPELVSDRLSVEQILSNLIENAVKYLKPGRPGRIVVRGRRERNRVLFEVEDNGRGIDPRDHERVFDLFRRSGTQDQPGEGIGLAHVRALAYRLGGTIACDSALDEGATFRLSLPPTYVAIEESAA